MEQRGTEELEMVGLKPICWEVRWCQHFLLEGFMVFFVCLFVLFSLLTDIKDVDF